MKAYITVNLPDNTEYDVVEQISVETLKRLVEALELPDDWTSVLIVLTNPESRE